MQVGPEHHGRARTGDAGQSAGRAVGADSYDQFMSDRIRSYGWAHGPGAAA